MSTPWQHLAVAPSFTEMIWSGSSNVLLYRQQLELTDLKLIKDSVDHLHLPLNNSFSLPSCRMPMDTSPLGAGPGLQDGGVGGVQACAVHAAQGEGKLQLDLGF